MLQVTLLAMAKDTLPHSEMSVNDGLEAHSDERNDDDDAMHVDAEVVESCFVLTSILLYCTYEP